ncbi:DUF6538 domain-containing protein [Rhizobium sp. RHZ01]|uniref:DUF6538 domain-containing protein n=1 Tax=Rhizobium sp. RHZ01 TaxID=2769304 RepID=UPI00177E85E2|nr:DUF6538 domain-containing protein [Rhizobium sp. RHZ01]MBD9444105.1 hypothetical protein [Rhizobium sp. RHZ01]
MVHLITNPTKGPNGVYYYVKRVPKDLIAKIGKERYSISLRTKDPRGAKRLCGEMDVQKDREFRALREGPQPLAFKVSWALRGWPHLPRRNQADFFRAAAQHVFI